MRERIEAEIALLRGNYPDVQHGQDLNWVLLPVFPLPNGVYNRAKTRMLILVPPGYPQTPPDNFYVDSGLRTASEEAIDNYSDGAGVPIEGNWGMFSWHVDGNGWRPGITTESGDNLLTLVRSIGIRLREGK